MKQNQQSLHAGWHSVKGALYLLADDILFVPLPFNEMLNHLMPMINELRRTTYFSKIVIIRNHESKDLLDVLKKDMKRTIF